MAKKKTQTVTRSAPRAMVLSAPRPAPITVNMPRPLAAPKAKKSRGGGRRRGGGGGGDIMTVVGVPALAGLILGYIDKGGTNIPTIPMLGRAGTLAAACYFFRSKERHLAPLAGGFAAIAMYEWQRLGSVAGQGIAAEWPNGEVQY